jgi:calcineurin-like phosphoesterase family protein
MRASVRLIATAFLVASTTAAASGPFAFDAIAAQPICGKSATHTLCVSLPDGLPTDAQGLPVLAGDQPIVVTNKPNSSKIFYTWLPDGGSAVQLMRQDKPSALSNDYSFVWPTTKYFDAIGTLRLQASSTSSAAVDIRVDLSNGNITDIQHTANDWTIPAPWTGASDAVFAAVGDGPDGTKVPARVEASIEARDPALFLFLGDIYESGTYTEDRNHYGASALDDPATATSWGRMAAITQPTVGNHEFPNLDAWTDYWHGRPEYVSFDFAGVRFFDLDANASFGASNAQYDFVRDRLPANDPTAPSCIVAYWHQPAITNGKTVPSELPMWKLLATGGGDLVLNGHVHSMAEFQPLNGDGALGQDAHMVELIAGSGGNTLGATMNDSRLAWALGKTAGALFLTAVGSGAGSTSSLSWSFQDANANVLRTGSVAC